MAFILLVTGGKVLSYLNTTRWLESVWTVQFLVARVGLNQISSHSNQSGTY